MRLGASFAIVAAWVGVVAACRGGDGTSEFTETPQPPSLGLGPSPATPAGTGPAAQPAACDPLIGKGSAPTTLTGIVAAGRAKDGTIYVIDNGGREAPRVFISHGTVLQEQEVLGSGGTGNDVAVSLDGEVQLEVANGQMNLRQGDPDLMTKLAPLREELTMLTASDLASYTPMTLGETIDLAFDAVTPSGHHLVITEPRHATSSDELRLFYGLPNAMVEQHADINNSSATWASFTLDGASYTAYLPGFISAPANGLPTLSINLGTPAVERLPLTYVVPAIDFDPNGGGLGPDGGAEPFAVARDGGTSAPGSELTFTSCL